MDFKIAFIAYFILTLTNISLNSAVPVNLTNFLPSNLVQNNEFLIPCNGPNCRPLVNGKIPGYPLPANYRFPPLPYPQNALQPPYCYTDFDCASSFANASQGICKHRPKNVLPSICDCEWSKRIVLNGGGRPGLHTCVDWTCSRSSDCQYNEFQAPWLLELIGNKPEKLCRKKRNSRICSCANKAYRNGCKS